MRRFYMDLENIVDVALEDNIDYSIKYDIDDSIKQLREKFNEIKNRGWIESSCNGFGDAGLTFEKELGLFRNELEIPDFDGIEIKTKRDFSRPFICLFNANLDGEYLFNIEEFVRKYGWPDKKIKDSYNFYALLQGDKFNIVGYKWMMKINVNYHLKKVFLEIFGKNGSKSTREYSWSFELLQEKLLRKLKHLAYIKVKRKKVNGVNYFLYDEINFFELKSFDVFLNLLSNGGIKINFNVGVYRDERRYGKIHNHGVAFYIAEDNINALFKQLF